LYILFFSISPLFFTHF